MLALRASILSAAACAALAPAAAAQATLHELMGPPMSRYGLSVASMGDVDGDGVPDLAVGAPEDFGLAVRAGSVYIVSGATGATLRHIRGQATDDFFGVSVSSTLDIDGDGVRELIVGAPGYDTPLADAGRVYVISGAQGHLLFPINGSAAGDLAGWTVAGLDDLDGDGLGDFAWGAPFSDAAGTDSGQVRVRSGGSPFINYTLNGPAANARFGYALDAAGDVDGDGLQDMIIGAPLASGGSGKAYVHSGPTGAFLFQVNGFTGGQMGFAVTGVGDQDGDGLADVAVGEPYWMTNGMAVGRVSVRTAQAPSSTFAAFQGQPDTLFGTSVDGIGDADGDGKWELIVGAPNESPFGNIGRGAVRVFRPTQPSAGPLYTLFGKQDLEGLGRTVAAAGDLNGDGFADWVAAAPSHDPQNQQDAGRVQIVLSAAPEPQVYCTSKLNSGGCTPAISYTGCPSVSVGDNFVLHAASVLPLQPGVAFRSFGTATIPFQGGFLCLAPPTVRLPAQQSGGSAANPCSGTYAQPFGNAQLAGSGAAPGTHLRFQFWSRDPGLPPPHQTGLTDALDVVVLP